MRGDACSARGGQVCLLVANEKAGRNIDIPMLHQIQQHSRFRLAPWMTATILLNSAIGMVWAEAPVIDMRTLQAQLRVHPIEQQCHILNRVVPARNAGLIGDHEHIIAKVVGQPDSIYRAINPAEPVGCADIAFIMIQDAIPVEKQSWPG